MNPRHNNPTGPGRIAHAPYNFVPLPERAVPAEKNLPDMDRYYHERYTGVIECEIMTESPVYVRGMNEPDSYAEFKKTPLHEMSDERKRQYARFYSLDNNGLPAIPGSSLRGMVRSIVEVASYGKIQWVTNKPLVFRAVGDTSSLGVYYRELLMRDDEDGRKFTPLVQAGYLVKVKDRWFIQPALSVQGVTFARIHKDKIPSRLPTWHECKNARCIWIKPGDYDYQKVRGYLQLKYLPVSDVRSSPAEGFMKAILVSSGNIPKKKMEAVIFPPDESVPVSKLIEINDEILLRYREQVSQQQEYLLGGKDGALKPYQPVFYLLENGVLVFFGHTMMFRLPYEKSPHEFIPPSLRPDTSEVNLDMAEAIFGFAPKGNKDRCASRAGRISFCDAMLNLGEEDIWLSGHPIIPKILSGPKPTAFQHYLTQQQPDKVPTGSRDRKVFPKLELRLDHYASPPPHDTVIRGHKFYWHKGQVRLSDIKDKEQYNLQIDKQHTLFSPVKPGVKFHSMIHFENLSKVELGAILWALLLPGEHGKEYRHKIGMGKPLGLGSIKIIPKLFLDNRKNRYERLFSGPDWHQARSFNEDLYGFINVFEEYVLKELCPEDRQGADRLSKTKRIQMFLKLLEWPGLKDRELTEYMNINEFKSRPVLPDPLHVEAIGDENDNKQCPQKAPSKDNINYHNSSIAEAFRKAEKKRDNRK